MKYLQYAFFVFLSFFLFSQTALAQGRLQGLKNKLNSSTNRVPKEVQETLIRYVEILHNSPDLDACAQAFATIAGGTLINEDGQTLRNTVAPFSLKKDFNNIKFYALPLKITRVDVKESNGTGYGPSAIRGTVYKIWIDKKRGVNGMPAPVSIMVPKGHSFIKEPKVINIGSF